MNKTKIHPPNIFMNKNNKKSVMVGQQIKVPKVTKKNYPLPMNT